MPRPPKPFAVYRRSGYRTFQLTLSPTCGLPAPVCRQWKRRSFQDFPPELAQHRLPQTKTAAQAGALALIEFLKKTDEPIRTPVDRISVGAWLEKFTRMEGNPKAALNEAKNRPYSLNTISRYEGLYRVYIKNDPFAALPMAELDEADALEFVFSYKDGTTPGPSWIKGRFKKWMARAGIETGGRRIAPHSARHSLASLLEARGVPLRYIQELLGHYDLKTTLGYLHSPEGTIRAIGKKIEEARANLDTGQGGKDGERAG